MALRRGVWVLRYFEVTDCFGRAYYFAVDDGAGAKRLIRLARVKKIREIDVNTYFLRVREREVRYNAVVYRQIRTKKRDSAADHF